MKEPGSPLVAIVLTLGLVASAIADDASTTGNLDS
jgi:hypothetical protein